MQTNYPSKKDTVYHWSVNTLDFTCTFKQLGPFYVIKDKAFKPIGNIKQNKCY